MNRPQLIDNVAKRAMVNRDDVAMVMASFLGGIIHALSSGYDLHVSRFGSFVLKERAAKNGDDEWFVILKSSDVLKERLKHD
jgi:nucleoid DNA-binding protein